MTMHEMFGDVIHSYTRAEAIEDGVLVDVTGVAAEAGFKTPVAMTRAAWDDLVVWDPDHGTLQDESGRLWDVVWMAAWAAKRSRGTDRVKVQLYRVPNRPRCTVARAASFTTVCSPGDDGEPVVTFMLAGES